MSNASNSFKYAAAFGFAVLFFLSFALKPGYANTGGPGWPRTFTEKIMPDPPTEKILIDKYAGLLKTDDAYIKKNMALYRFIDQWMGTPYRWGGCGRNGIDCSCFVMTLFRDVFGVKINRTTFTQFYAADVDLFTNREQYQLGDLIFFKTNIARETRRNRITHVGLYLTNGYFVQSSSSGVNIANLNGGYWKRCVVAAGRLKGNYYKKARIAMPDGAVQDKKTLELEEDSNFEPVPYPEDMEQLINEYAGLLDVNKEKFLVPEVFEFIKRNQYAPYKMNSLCGKRLSDNYCFISTLFQDVFNVGLDSSGDARFLTANAGKLPSKELKSFLDIVQLKQEAKGKTEIITGVYLYNNFFLHLQKNDITLTKLSDSAGAGEQPVFYRIKEDILKKVFENILALRKGMLVIAKDGLPTPLPQPPVAGPGNELKPDTLATPIKKDTLLITGPPKDGPPAVPFVGPLPDHKGVDTSALPARPSRPQPGVRTFKKKRRR
jgi:murein DD-endopeptidase / murein LD-carboxypeptidase